VLKAVPGQGIGLLRLVAGVTGVAAEVRSQAAAGLTEGGWSDLGDMIDQQF